MRLHGIFLIVKQFYTDFTFPLFLILHSDFTMQLWLRDGEHRNHDNIEVTVNIHKRRKEENEDYEENISNGISNGYDNCEPDSMRRKQAGRDDCCCN